MDGPAAEHEARAAAHAAQRRAGAAVLTVSDTRTLASDRGGALAATLLREAGIDDVRREIVRDEPEEIRAALRRFIDDPGVQVALTTGGTGLARRDTTVEVVRGLLARELPGFGELFRMLSYQQVRSAAMLSGALGGLATSGAGGDTLIFALPGSPAAVELALRELIVPQLPHMLWLRE
jgi:molybdenum cofactor biosynthesis protein B